MGMTATEKIIVKHCGKNSISVGEIIEVTYDMIYSHDNAAPLAISQFKKLPCNHIKDASKVSFFFDHCTPNKDIDTAEHCRVIKEFAENQGIESLYEGGRAGIQHMMIPELGMVTPGDLIMGNDSHTPTLGAIGALAMGFGSTDIAAAWATGKTWLRVPKTIKLLFEGIPRKWVSGKDLILFALRTIGINGAAYMVVEFAGSTIAALSMNQRFTMCNMAVEMGAKSAIMPVDSVAQDYLSSRVTKNYTITNSDNDADFAEEIKFKVDQLEPQIAFPHLPSNVKPVSKASHIRIDQCFIGSCSNAWLDDLRIAAKVLKGHTIHPKVRMIVIPGTPQIYLKALNEGLIKVFCAAGAVIGPPTCGPCGGNHFGILGKGERAIATINRNYPGRMGHPESEIYLANPSVVSASAVLGRIASPEELM